MTESIPSVCKTVSWLLAILLIGVVALYNWHFKNQKEILTGKEAQIAKSAQLLEDAQQKLDKSEESSRALRTQLQELEDKLKAADQVYRELQENLKAIEAQHAQTLAAAQEKAHQAYAELQGRYDGAKERIATLGAKIEQLEQMVTNAAATHEAKMLEAKKEHEARLAEIEAAQQAKTARLVQQVNEKIDFYRTALEGSEPERASLLANLKQQIGDHRQAIEKNRQAMQSMQEKATHFQEQLAGANRTIAAREQALSESAQKLEAAQSALAQEQSAHAALQQEHEATLTETTEALAKLQEELQTAKTARKRMETEAAAALKAAKATHAHEMKEVEDKISGLEQTLEQTRHKATQDLVACRQEGEAAVSHVRGIFTEFSKLQGQYTDRGVLLSLAENELRFRVSKADLPEGELPSLDQIAELLVKYPKLTARIEGHTDSQGRDETNLELSRQRADAVKQALMERGVDEQRMTAQGIGATRPIADNASALGRSKNRRVEIYVIEH